MANAAFANADIKVDIDAGELLADPYRGDLMWRMRQLWAQGELCDLVIMVGDQKFAAHSVVLGAASARLQHLLEETLNTLTHHKHWTMSWDSIVRHPEAVQYFLAFVYGALSECDAAPSDDAVRDVVCLAQVFDLRQLHDAASQWLLTGVSAGNVLQRLAVADEFALTSCRKELLDRVTANPQVLYALATSPNIVSVPAVLQDLLVRVLTLLGCARCGGA